MTKLAKRLLVFIIGVPFSAGVVLLLPYKAHLAANILVILLSAFGALEFAALLKKKNNPLGAAEAAILGVAAPLAATLTVSFGADEGITGVVCASGAFWLLTSRIFSPEERVKDALNRAAAGFAVTLYPGAFMAWIIRMGSLPRASPVILVFLLMVVANDSGAWAAGVLFGRGNRGVVPVSPNKSVAGFIGGFACTMAIGLCAVIFLPEPFAPRGVAPPVAGLALGFIAALGATLGDLGESALKRSADTKDSGALIPGRGGVLDSIDSFCLAAPVYYIVYGLLFSPFLP
ncbi:MAG: phosphatidate cytidylyltransferase [Spirochaetaceae bacterium]|jgi:phosphatidate cytidylyltransferase|nr:phosphatidate cytidylyltransferase [Spirochaetaceae bacterium]